MQVSVETTSAIERRLTITVPAQEVDSAAEQKMKEVRPNIRLDGFRPGKVPMNVIRQRYGASIRQEVMGDIINTSYTQAIEQENINPAGYPEIEPKVVEEGKDFEYVAVLEVFPKITVGDLTQISVEKPVAELKEEDVQTSLENIREQASTWEDVERAAKEGDQVVIDFKGMRDGEAFEGGTAENSTLELGSGQMIPGFEEGIVGMSADEQKTIALSFPEDYHAEELKGAAVEFEINLKSVKERQLPEMNEAFFEQYGVTEGGEEAFMTKLRDNLERNLKQRTKDEIKRQVMDGLIETHTVTIPKAIIQGEIDALRQQSVQRFGGMANAPDIDFAKLLPDDMFQEEAQRRASLGLIVSALTEEQSIEVDEARVDALIEDMAASYDDKEQVLEYYKQEQARAPLRALALEDMVVDYVLEQAKQSEKSVTFEELMNPQPAPAEAVEESEENA